MRAEEEPRDYKDAKNAFCLLQNEFALGWEVKDRLVAANRNAKIRMANATGKDLAKANRINISKSQVQSWRVAFLVNCLDNIVHRLAPAPLPKLVVAEITDYFQVDW